MSLNSISMDSTNHGLQIFFLRKCFPGGAVAKNPSANAGDARNVGLIPALGRSPEARNGNPLQYSCLENSIEFSEPGKL